MPLSRKNTEQGPWLFSWPPFPGKRFEYPRPSRLFPLQRIGAKSHSAPSSCRCIRPAIPPVETWRWEAEVADENKAAQKGAGEDIYAAGIHKYR